MTIPKMVEELANELFLEPQELQFDPIRKFARNVLELAAKECEEVSYDFMAKYGFTEKRKDQINYNQRSIGADVCTARIRALKGE